MDFHAMKRKELQALCKKHKIPANLTNLEMANRLASLLETEQEQPRKTLGKSCLKSVDELGDVDENTGDVKVAKKVRFSPEDQTFVFEKTNPRAVRLAARRRKSLLLDEVKVQGEENVLSLDAPSELPQKASEKAAADKRVRSTRSRRRGKNTEQADLAEAELLQAEEGNGCKKASQKRASSLVDSELFPEDPGNVPQKASEKVVADKRVKSTRSRGRGKKTEQADAAEAELLQDEENHGRKKKSQKRVGSSVDSEVPTLVDEGEAKGVLRRSSRNAGRPNDFASLAKDVYIVGSPKRKTRSDCPPRHQDAEKVPKRGLRSNRLKETHENSVDEANEDVHETVKTTHNTRQKKRARGLAETVSSAGSDYFAEPPRQRRSSRASNRRGLGTHEKVDDNEVFDKSDAEIQEAEPPRQRSSRASTRRGFGAHGKVDGNEVLDKSGAEIQEVGFITSEEKSRKKDIASQPGKSDDLSWCDGTRNSLDAQTDVAGGSPLAKSASDAEDTQNLPYSSPKAAKNYQGKDQPLCQTAPTLLLEECEFKNVEEESCKPKTSFGELAEASKAKTHLKNKSSTGKAVSTGRKQHRNSPFITSKEGIHVDSYRSDNQNIEEDFKEADAEKQAENINRDASEGAESLLLPSSGLRSAPRSVASTVPAEDNKLELVTPVLEANSGVQCDPSLTSNNIEDCAGPLSFQGTGQVQNEAASPIYVLEKSEPNNAFGEASVSKNIEQDDHAPLPNTTTIDDQCQSAFKTSTVDTVTSTAKGMQNGEEPIISGEEGITVDLYNLENQITEYFETARSDPFPALLESQTGLHQPTDESAASPLMSNEPLHSQVDKCLDHLVAHECSKVESKEAVEGFTPGEMLGRAMLEQSPKQELEMKGSKAVDTVECIEKALEESSPLEMLDDASDGAEKSVSGSLDEGIESDGSPEQGLEVKSHIAGDTMKSIENNVEGLCPTAMLYHSSEGADKSKLVNEGLCEDIESDGGPKQELAVKSNTAEDVVKPTEFAAQGLTPAEVLNENSESAGIFISERVDENTDSEGSPGQELAKNRDIARDAVESTEKKNIAGNAVESTENAVEGLNPMLIQNTEGAGRVFIEREDESTESHGISEQELDMTGDVAGDAVGSTEIAVEGLNPMLIQNTEGAGRVFIEREDESTGSHGISEQELAMTSDVAGDPVGSTEIAVKVYTPTEMLNERSEGSENFISGSVDGNTEPDSNSKQELDMKRNIAGESVESTEEEVEGFTRLLGVNENSEGAGKFVCDKSDETNESDGSRNQGLAKKCDLQFSVHEDTSFDDPEERVESCPMEEGVQRPEVVHGNDSSVVRSDPERRYMTETSGDEGEGHREIVESGECLYDAEICMEEADLAGKTGDLTSNGTGCSDIGGSYTAKVHKVSPTSSRFSDRMELVAGSKERRELICADYLDFKSPGSQSALNLGDGEAGDIARQTIENASSAMCNEVAEENMVSLECAANEQISMHLCDDRDNSAFNIQASSEVCLIEDDMTAASEATEGQVPLDCFFSEPEPAHVRHTLQGEELENIASNEAAVDLLRSPEEKLKSAVKANAQDENVKSPEAFCPVEKLHSADNTRLGDILGHGVLEVVPERNGGHGHVVDETALSSDKSEDYGGENFSVAMEAEESGEKQYKEADNHYVEGLTPVAKVEEMHEGVDSVASEKRVDTSLYERSLEQGLANENNMQLTRNEDVDCDTQERNSEMYPAEESTQRPAVKPENSGSQDFELTGYETALFMGDKFGDEAGKPDFETSERCWWISSSTTDYSKGGENGMEQAVGDHIISKQGSDSTDFPVSEKSAVCDKSELTEKKVALEPCEAKCEDMVHFEHCKAFEKDTGKVDCEMNNKNYSVDQQGCDFSDKDDSTQETVAVSADFIEPSEGKNEHVVHSEPCDVFEEDVGRDECVKNGENHSMDQAEKDILEDLMKEDEMHLSSTDDDTMEGGGNGDFEDQVTAAYSKMFSMMPDDMFITADVEGTSKIANRNAENVQRDDLGVTTLVFAASTGSSHLAEGKLKEGTLAEEDVDGNDNREKGTLEHLNHLTPTRSVENLEDETASLDDQPMAGIIHEEDETLASSMEDNKMDIENQQSCNGEESGARMITPLSEMSATVMNDQHETSDVKDSIGILKKDEAMPQQEETKDARRQEVNISYSREPASLMNHKKRSIMIHGTPKRPIIASDMKENSTTHGRKGLVADATAQRPLARRKALGELPRM